MAFADVKGIALTSGFKLEAESLLDVRGAVDDITGRDELVTLHAAPVGLIVFVKSEKKTYVYNGEDWVLFTTGEGYVHPEHHPATMITQDETHKFVTDTQIAAWNNKAEKTLASADSDGLMSSEQFTKIENLDSNLEGKVDKTTTINGKALSENITLDAASVGAIPTTEKGSNNGVAELDSTGKVPSTQLPSYVDDVLEGYLNEDGKFYEEEGHTTEITAESGKIYVDLTDGKNLTYRWSGSAYVEIAKGLALGETDSTAYRGDRGKIAYDHSQTPHAKADATKTEKSETNGNVKIDGAEVVVYTHPASHDATMINEDASHRFVTDAEKTAWGAKANIYWAADGTEPASAPIGSLCFLARVAGE